MAVRISEVAEAVCVRAVCKQTRIEHRQTLIALGEARMHIRALESHVARAEAEVERLKARFDWTSLGGETFARRLTAIERRILEALPLDGSSASYLAICIAVWPEWDWATRISRQAALHPLRVNLARIRRKLEGTDWEVVTHNAYGLSLQRRTR